MIDVKQFTNYDDLPLEDGYRVIILPAPAFRLGYCGDTSSIGQVIYITINERRVPFQIGETGIFEFNRYNLENDDKEEDACVYATEVRVPDGVSFTLDYMFD